MTITPDSSSVRTQHRTDKYRTRTLVVRRGFPVTLQIDGPSITLSLFNVRPSRDQVLDYSFSLSPGDSTDDGWALNRAAAGSLQLDIPADAPVGAYRVRDDGDSSAIAMVVLFNPFSPDDTVYMADEALRDESVLDNAGLIWRGSARSNVASPWQYAQFQTIVLICALDLVDVAAAKNLNVRRNPIPLTRALSALMNSTDDDNGVVIGNWSGEYDDGTSPMAWTGSAEILTQYWESGGQPVPYGQCWVFAGVFASVLRSLGVPTTTVSNFSSAHETTRPYNRVVERFFATDGTPQDDKDMGSTWNFHVWNEAWMKRPDLADTAAEHGLEYDGWQVLDGTPQEPSMGLFQLGPCPVAAVKYGHEVPYDADFVISEVNADMVYYIQESEGSEDYRAFRKDERTIGQRMSIKSVGSGARNDVTLRYKFAEGTPEERESFNNRPSASVRPTTDADTPIELSVEVPDAVAVGDDIMYNLRMRNTSDEVTTVHYNVVADVTDYTGRSLGGLGSLARDVVVPAGRTRGPALSVSADGYAPALAMGATTLRFVTTAVVSGSGQAWSNEELVRIGLDDVLVLSSIPDEMTVGETSTVRVIVQNTTQNTLTRVILRVEGEDLTRRRRFDVPDLRPGETAPISFDITPSAPGVKSLALTLDSRELRDVSANATIRVSGSGSAAWEADDADDIDAVAGR